MRVCHWQGWRRKPQSYLASGWTCHEHRSSSGESLEDFVNNRNLSEGLLQSMTAYDSGRQHRAQRRKIIRCSCPNTRVWMCTTYTTYRSGPNCSQWSVCISRQTIPLDSRFHTQRLGYLLLVWVGYAAFQRSLRSNLWAYSHLVLHS